MADAYAARLIAAERWDELIGFIDMVERDRPNQYTVMFPEDLVAYEWESLREAAFEALGRWDELRRCTASASSRRTTLRPAHHRTAARDQRPGLGRAGAEHRHGVR